MSTESKLQAILRAIQQSGGSSGPDANKSTLDKIRYQRLLGGRVNPEELARIFTLSLSDFYTPNPPTTQTLDQVWSMIAPQLVLFGGTPAWFTPTTTLGDIVERASDKNVSATGNDALMRVLRRLTEFLWSIITMVVIGFLVFGLYKFFTYQSLISYLKAAEATRGIITFVVVVVTVGLGLLLMLFIISSSLYKTDDERQAFKDRLDYGKQVLGVFVGILGTIVGFYFGNTGKEPMSPLEFDATSRITVGSDNKDHIVTSIHGGKAPYSYSVKFNPPAPVKEGQSSTGAIDVTLDPADVATLKSFEITAKDSDGASGSYNENNVADLLKASSPSGGGGMAQGNPAPPTKH